MSSRFHNKWHRHNHHTDASPNPLFPDSSHDPIASPESPFLGDFILQGALSANAPSNAFAGNFLGDQSAILLAAPGYCLSGIGNTSLSGDVDLVGSLFVDRDIRSNNVMSMYRGEVDTDFTVYGSLSVLGQVSQVNVTNFQGVTALNLQNYAAGPVVDILQGGSYPILRVRDDTGSGIETVLYIPDNGNLGVKTTIPNKTLTVGGEISATGNVAFDSGITIGGATTISGILSSNNAILNSLFVGNGLTISGNISSNNLRTSFNQGSATGNYSFAVGSGKAFGIYSHAEGFTTASGTGSHAEGDGSIASGQVSHAEGDYTTASGTASHAEGSQAAAIGQVSHAEGGYTTAFGNFSHVEGQRSEAKGNTSHAAGFRATAAQNYTYAWSDGNLGTTTQNVSTTRSGQYMISASGGIYIPGNVGIGTDNNLIALTVVGDISATEEIYSKWNILNPNGGEEGGQISLMDPAGIGGWEIDNFARSFRIFRDRGVGNVTGVTITTGGNVGIGTFTPGAKLEIGGSIAETYSNPSIAAGVVSLNLGTATFFKVRVDSNISSFSLTDTPASPRVYSFTLQTEGDGNSRSITWTFNGVAVRWADNIGPIYTTTNNKIDTYSFVTYDGGTNWFGFVGGQNM